MPPRIRTLGYYLRYRQPVVSIVAAVGLLVVTVILLTSYSNKSDLALLTGALGVMGLAIGIYLFRRVQRRAPIAETLDEALEKAPSPRIAARMLRQAMWVVTIVFGVYGAWEAYGLTRLELGWADSASLSKPVADIYADFGFWPAGVTCSGFWPCHHSVVGEEAARAQRTTNRTDLTPLAGSSGSVQFCDQQLLRAADHDVIDA
jgi:hypothetical protein